MWKVAEKDCMNSAMRVPPLGPRFRYRAGSYAFPVKEPETNPDFGSYLIMICLSAVQEYSVPLRYIRGTKIAGKGCKCWSKKNPARGCI